LSALPVDRIGDLRTISDDGTLGVCARGRLIPRPIAADSSRCNGRWPKRWQRIERVRDWLDRRGLRQFQ
jgi:hypothetical protein